MYKNQSARWGFFKYAVKRRPRNTAGAESPTENNSDDSLNGALVLSRDKLLHASDEPRIIQAGLTAVRRFLHDYINLDPSNLQVEEVTGYVDPYYRYFKLAMDLFDLEENLEGGRILRLAFLQVERKVSRITIKSFSDLWCLVPHLLLESKRKNILSAYVHYLYRLATVKFGKHPVTELAASFASLVDGDRLDDIMCYITLLSQINSDTIAALPGMLDRNRQWARKQYLTCQRTVAEAVAGGRRRHDHHMIRLEAQSVYWAQNLVMHDPESDEMAAQWLQREFKEGFGPKAEAYLHKLKELADRRIFPPGFARIMETLYIGWLYDYYESVEQRDRAFEWGRKGLELSTDELYAIWSIQLEGLMRRYGSVEEAEQLRRRRGEHAWLEKVRLEVDRLTVA